MSTTLLETQAKPILEISEDYELKTKRITTKGLHRESRIDLVTSSFEGLLRTSVFIYPSEGYKLSTENISRLDLRFEEANFLISRDFKDVSVEELERQLERETTHMSIIDFSYSLHRPRVKEKVYDPDAKVYLQGIIKDLKSP